MLLGFPLQYSTQNRSGRHMFPESQILLFLWIARIICSGRREYVVGLFSQIKQPCSVALCLVSSEFDKESFIPTIVSPCQTSPTVISSFQRCYEKSSISQPTSYFPEPVLMQMYNIIMSGISRYSRSRIL